MNLTIDYNISTYKMRGGLGASWHTINDIHPLNNERYTIKVREDAPLGSACGGNPPVTYSKAWNQLIGHARWLGMNFCRVELLQKSYNPQKGEFDWKSDDMLALYKILDWAEENDVDIFLQQMALGAEWNAFPEIHPLISAPRNLKDHVESISTLLIYLTKEKGYSCIKYFCMANEPPPPDGQGWGYWWEYGDHPGRIEDAWKLLREEFDLKGLPISISGPDWVFSNWLFLEKMECAAYFDSIDIHCYSGLSDKDEEGLSNWANWAHGNQKPFFLSEYGNMELGWQGKNPAQKTFAAALSNAKSLMRGMRSGVDGFNKWSYTNRGDLDGQWQMVKTYDIDTHQYLEEAVPENEAYYGFGIISRFFSKTSEVLYTTCEAADDVLMYNAVKSPGGKLSIFLVNLSEEELDVTITVKNIPKGKLHLYQVTKEKVISDDFKLNPVKSFIDNKQFTVSLPPQSISTCTENELYHTDAGITLN